MTERQLKLKDEIIKIANHLQLGIDKKDVDWFYKFTQRMSVQEKIDSLRTVTGWSRISSNPSLTYDFIQEFINKINIEEAYFSGNQNIPIEDILEICNKQVTYLCGYKYIAVMYAAKDERLTNEMVIKYENLLDQTCGRQGGNAIPCYGLTAWYYIHANKSITGELHSLSVIKPHFN